MPSYKLTYFDITARGEVSRLLFTFAGVKFEDERISREQWPKLKDSTPFGQLPYLTKDGQVLCQSNTIARYLAKEFGLAGKGNWDQARADMVVDCMEDIMRPIAPAVIREKDKTKQNEMRRSYEKEKLTPALANLEKILNQNGGGNGYFVGDDVTWADLTVMSYYHWLESSAFAITVPLDKYPKLKSHRARIESHPKIANYLKTRPKTWI